MSILGKEGTRPGEKGVMGVEAPFVLPEDRFIMRELEIPSGDLMLEEPEAREDMDLEVERDGFVSATGFAAFSRREKSPMAPCVAVRPSQWPRWRA